MCPTFQIQFVTYGRKHLIGFHGETKTVKGKPEYKDIASEVKKEERKRRKEKKNYSKFLSMYSILLLFDCKYINILIMVYNN
jgi:hypothetical protein